MRVTENLLFKSDDMTIISFLFLVDNFQNQSRKAIDPSIMIHGIISKIYTENISGTDKTAIVGRTDRTRASCLP